MRSMGATAVLEMVAEMPPLMNEDMIPPFCSPQRGFKLPWREAGPPNHHDETVDSDQ